MRLRRDGCVPVSASVSHHMNRRRLLVLLATVIGAFGLASLTGAFLLDDVTPFLRATSVASGAMLVVAAGLLFGGRRLALSLLWLSVTVYFVSIVGPAIHRHGDSAFSVLMGAFYWSIVTRIAFALCAHRLLRSVSDNG